MLEGLYSAAAGMAAQQVQLDAVSNDLANLNTDGYKSERVGFNDLLYNKVIYTFENQKEPWHETQKK